MTSTNPSPISKPVSPEIARCQHRTLRGRCRQPATDATGTLCFDHARAAIQARDDFAVLPSLVRKPEDFQSAEDLNQSLAALHNLLAEGRISPRRAAVIAYVDSLILRSITAIQLEEKNQPVELIFDAPRPQRDLPDDQPQPRTSAPPPQETVRP